MPKFSRNEINIAKIMLTLNKKQFQKLKNYNKSKLIVILKKTK